jgi:hypothetical protein
MQPVFSVTITCFDHLLKGQSWSLSLWELDVHLPTQLASIITHVYQIFEPSELALYFAFDLRSAIF